MNFVESEIFDEGYKKSLKLLLSNGQEINPRGLETIELSPFVFTLKNPRTRIINNPSRNINLGFNIMEFLSIIGGDDRVEILSRLNSSIVQFSDDGKVFRGAYGPRLINWEHINQFENVINKLKEDNSSRQAIMTIFDPYLDFVKTKDVPCTIMFHFLIRNNKLNMNTYMRSNDAMLGHVIDIFVFTMIQELIANELEIDLGEYNHFIGSFHLYKKDINKARKIIDDNSFEFIEMPKMEGKFVKAYHSYYVLTNSIAEPVIGISNNYWLDLVNVVKFQIKLKEKKYNEIDTNIFNNEIYKKYFERKLWAAKK